MKQPGADQRPGESFWAPYASVRSVQGMSDTPGSTVRVTNGEHKGKQGIVRQHDGLTGMTQIRTGDPEAWKAYDAETARLLKAIQGE